jgi:hypothetical protein
VSRRIAAACAVVACLMGPTESLAQVATTGDAIKLPVTPLFLPQTIEQPAPGFWTPFQAIPNDFVRFFSRDTMKVVGVGGLGALAAHQWDRQGIEEAQEHLRPGMFRAGTLGGGFCTQSRRLPDRVSSRAWVQI